MPANDGFSGTTVWPVIPFPALIGGISIGIVAALIVCFSWYFDRHTRGFLTISVLVVVAFIVATLGSMIYQVPTNATTEILVGALSTALGAIIAQWVGRGRGQHDPPPAPDQTDDR